MASTYANAAGSSSRRAVASAALVYSSGARGDLTPRIVNLPQPAGVQWEVVAVDGCCDICQDVIDGSPYPEDDLPDVPVHPNCDCELQVAYGVDNQAPSAIEAEASRTVTAIRPSHG